jgi:PAS domain-containing protein
MLIAGLGSVGYRYLSEEIRRETHRTLAVIVEQKRQQIEGWLSDARVDTDLSFYGHSQLEILFSQWTHGGRKDAPGLKRIQTLMTQMAEARGWAGLAIVDADATRLRRRRCRRPGPHRADPGHPAPARVELVDLHRNADGKVHYGVLAPIGSPDMEPLGVAYVTWSADQALNPLVGAWPVPTQSAETYLVRRDGDSVRFLTPLRFNRDAALVLGLPVASPDMPAARAARGERGIIEGGRDYRRAPVLAYAAAVAGTPWLMIAEIDEAEAYAGVRTIAWATTILAGLGLTFVYSGGYLLWRRSRQRHELAALQAERAAEARFRVVFEQAPLGIALLDPGSGRFTDANPRLCEILGRSPRARRPQPPAHHPPGRHRRERRNAARLKSGEIPATASTSATCARTARWCGPASPARRCAWTPRRPRATSTSSRTSPPAVRWRSSCASARRATA